MHTGISVRLIPVLAAAVTTMYQADPAGANWQPQSADWKPATGPLATKWAKEVTPENAHREYPRPQLVRPSWVNLNGLWEYAITKIDASRPDKFDGQILVPFAIESALSGVMKRVGPDERLWYRRRFMHAAKPSQRVLLHFGAADWETVVWVNGQRAGEHRGGYDPFTFDITDSLKDRTEHELVVSTQDPTDSGTQPRGKQIQNPHGIWYTPTTGIWQTVWLEPVPRTYIESLRTVPDVDHSRVVVTVITNAETSVTITVSDTGKTAAQRQGKANQAIELPIDKAKLWSPDSPFLYDLSIQVDEPAGDSVTSYFGMRKSSLGKDGKGITRMMLNNEFVFQYGPLDQGFWPDGLYTAPTDEALKYDIELTKRLGFNMARKHVKVEPARWYYWCDKLGLLVWQDMPSGDKYIRASDPDIERSAESTAQFEREWSAIIRANFNSPSIVMWVPFNEGWGQFDTARIAQWTRTLDPTRLVDSASGWTDRGVGDVHDIHVYPGPGMPRPEPSRAAVLGEFGGLGLPIEGHTWQDKRNWGYRNFDSSTALTDAYVLLLRQLHPLVGEGLSAAVYTQTTDVEIEVNGLMTYDRAMIKMDADKITAANKRLFEPPPTLKTIVPSSQTDAQTWRYTTNKPGDNWFDPKFDDSSWKQAPGGFGTQGTPGTTVRTRWDSPDVWIRRTIKLDKAPKLASLVIHHDEDAEIYINGQLAAQVKGYTTSYAYIPLSADATKALRTGDNCIAVHCRQTGGGQYIDLGLVEEVPAN